MQDPMIRHTFVQVNESFVHVAQYGLGNNLIKSPSMNPNSRHSTDSDSTSSSHGNKASSTSFNSSNSFDLNRPPQPYLAGPKKLIIFMPGNPGVIGIYHDFLLALFRSITTGSSNSPSSQLPTILALSHNNFDHPDNVHYKADERILIEEKDLNFFERSLFQKHSREPHHIDLQILNKLIILKRLLGINIANCKVIFIGHSIGCYVILKLLQDRVIAKSHGGSIMIHPALENMAITKKGAMCDNLFRYKMDILMTAAAFLVDNLLPRPAKLALTKWICSNDFAQQASSTALESVMQLVCHKTLTAMIEMAKSEFANVKDINIDSLIKPHISRLKLIYAIDDHWVNTENRLALRNSFPELYMEEHSTLHAFVMDPQTSMDYAVKVGMFVQDMIDTIGRRAELIDNAILM